MYLPEDNRVILGREARTGVMGSGAISTWPKLRGAITLVPLGPGGGESRFSKLKFLLWVGEEAEFLSHEQAHSVKELETESNKRKEREHNFENC